MNKGGASHDEIHLGGLVCELVVLGLPVATTGLGALWYVASASSIVVERGLDIWLKATVLLYGEE